jgi:hypothetical protein
VATGYSGKGEGLDNPDLQDVPDEGPIPEGTYTIGSASTHPGKGPVVMELEPDPSNPDVWAFWISDSWGQR